MLNPGDLLGERYEILSRIGQGGMSYVYRALDRKLGRNVAIKVLKEEFSTDEDFIRKFKNEAQSVASLIHPNIIAAYDAVDEGDLHYITMELVEGISLKNYIKKKGVLTNKEAIHIALSTAEGIAEAHRKGIIHRDIKPQNVIISEDGKVKVADFGIAKAVTGETISTAVLGSAHYISPEQAKNGTFDERSDIYSLGITMYEMITGQLPFDGENTVSVVMAHINQAPVPPKVYNDRIYPSFNDIILKCIRKNPENRYQSADELIKDLKKSLNEPEGTFVDHLDGGRSKSEEDGEDDPYESLISKKVLLIICLSVLAAASLVLLLHHFDKKKHQNMQAPSEAAEEYHENSTSDIVISGEKLMPSLIGMTCDEAEEVLQSYDVQLVPSKEEFNDVYLSGRIMNQKPEEGSSITENTKVYVTVSLGSKLESVINSLKGTAPQQAEERLSDVGITVSGQIRQFSEDVPEGMVVGYILDDSDSGAAGGGPSGSENRTITEGSSVKLILSAGREGDGLVMPSLVGLSQTELEGVLAGNGLQLGTVTRTPVGDTYDGRVVYQSIPAGELTKKGSVVDISVNLEGDTPLENADPENEDIEILSPEYYYTSIDTSCMIGTPHGPSGAKDVVNVGIRLGQNINDAYELTVITEPRAIQSGTRIPVSFRNLQGAYGVDKGFIEVYDADTNTAIATYEVEFHPVY